MTDRSDNRGRGYPPAAPFLSFKRLFGRPPSGGQQARLLGLQQKFALRAGDSIFVIISILELYLAEVEAACMEVRRSARRTVFRSCLLAAVGVVVISAPLYLMEPHIRSFLGWAPLSSGTTQPFVSPLRAYMRATLDSMTDDDIARLATSGDAVSIIELLPRTTDDDLKRVYQYLRSQTSNGR